MIEMLSLGRVAGGCRSVAFGGLCGWSGSHVVLDVNSGNGSASLSQRQCSLPVILPRAQRSGSFGIVTGPFAMRLGPPSSRAETAGLGRGNFR